MECAPLPKTDKASNGGNVVNLIMRCNIAQSSYVTTPVYGYADNISTSPKIIIESNPLPLLYTKSNILTKRKRNFVGT